ncbi:MAG: hypothetical protein ACE5R6_03490 [Candidatus Heimdallarchaeota archaeon]
MRDFTSVCPHTQGYIMQGIYMAFEKATRTLEEGNTNLANFFFEKIVQKLQSLAGTRLLSENNARIIAQELIVKIQEMNLKFSKTTIGALEEVTNLISS